ncbi:hypothetical protein Tco_1371379 [Tanacetum coccineum]
MPGTSLAEDQVNPHPADHDELKEPKKISKALQDDSWVKAMQEELLQFRLQQCRILTMAHIRDGRGCLYVSLDPPGFVDPDHPKKVYKRSMDNRRGTIDKYLVIKKDKTRICHAGLSVK